ncbi:MAG: CbiM family transporter [Firmicutes bacterium]|nr:CbiM family transporter [Bacillota bacterium]
MHILDGVLSPPVVAVTSVAAAALVGWSLKGVRERDIPKIAVTSALFFVGSLIHVNIGASSVHLLLSGIIGLVLGRRTPVAISIALILQLLILQFGGLTSLGANIIDVSIPAMLVSALVRPYLGRSRKLDLAAGAACGGVSVVLTVVFVSLMLIESNMRFGFGPFSAVSGLMIGHIPVMIIEAVVTAFAVAAIMKSRPQILGLDSNGNAIEKQETEKEKGGNA